METSVSPPGSREAAANNGVVTPHAPTPAQRLVAWLVFGLSRALTLTLRYRWEDRSGFFERPPAGQAIYAVWHNRLALCLEAYFHYARRRNRTAGLAALVSASRDGALLAAILERFGVLPVRGSSSRRGGQALVELVSWAERGYDLAITPDGPRGPRYLVQEGVIALAQLTGLPILPAGYRLNWKLQLNSWDGFLVPLPFARCHFVIGRPVLVSRDADAAQREALRRQLEAELRAVSGD
jgi:lysophospholipid acyltransferase (LPLAT)-like uncharacterized protein